MLRSDSDGPAPHNVGASLIVIVHLHFYQYTTGVASEFLSFDECDTDLEVNKISWTGDLLVLAVKESNSNISSK